MTSMPVERVHPDVLQKLLDDNNVDVAPLRPKMVATRSGEYIKFFYDQPGLHWSSFYPKAKRFTDNAHALLKFGFVAPRITRLAHCPEEMAWFIVYKRLPGDDVRELADSSNLKQMANFLAHLHQKGIYFRGIHLGNVLVTENTYSLIDFAGMTLWPMPLTTWQRLRNIGRFVSFPEDIELFKEYGVERFCAEYCDAAELKGWRRAWLTRAVLARVREAVKTSG
tara:strand:- start:5576 stop:6247 length:672 start_codon:yes stop_codon:yes gene_type:complete